jgi:hypothetical protein
MVGIGCKKGEIIGGTIAEGELQRKVIHVGKGANRKDSKGAASP